MNTPIQSGSGSTQNISQDIQRLKASGQLSQIDPSQLTESQLDQIQKYEQSLLTDLRVYYDSGNPVIDAPLLKGDLSEVLQDMLAFTQKIGGNPTTEEIQQTIKEFTPPRLGNAPKIFLAVLMAEMEGNKSLNEVQKTLVDQIKAEDDRQRADSAQQRGKQKAAAAKERKQAKKSKISKIFGWIGQGFAAIAGIAAIALSGGTLTPVVAVMMVALTYSMTTSALSEAGVLPNNKSWMIANFVISGILMIATLGAGVSSFAGKALAEGPEFLSNLIDGASEAAKQTLTTVLRNIPQVLASMSDIIGSSVGIAGAQDEKLATIDLSDAKQFESAISRSRGWVTQESDESKLIMELVASIFQSVSDQMKNTSDALSASVANFSRA